MHPPAELCVKCKGTKGLCGSKTCPILNKIKIQKPIFSNVKSDLNGFSPPNLLIGATGYPNVSVGLLASEEKVYDSPYKLYGHSLKEIVESRSKLYRSIVEHDIYKRDKFIEDLQNTILSTKEVNLEIKFKSTPKATLSVSPLVQPHGPTGIIEKYEITSNPKIPRKIDNLRNDELSAQEAIYELTSKKYDNYYITKVFNAGILGRNKRLVPTRWSITAIDDIISKNWIKKIKRFQNYINDITIYHNNYLDNNYTIIFLPGSWEFENIEAWAPGSLWNLTGHKETYISLEYENYHGKKKYAESQGGGYYASRFAITEYLHKLRKQARAIVIREIEPGYMVPVGVWQVRENIRNALKQKGLKVANIQELLEILPNYLKNNINIYKQRITILKQQKIHAWFKNI